MVIEPLSDSLKSTNHVVVTIISTIMPRSKNYSKMSLDEIIEAYRYHSEEMNKIREVLNRVGVVVNEMRVPVSTFNASVNLPTNQVASHASTPPPAYSATPNLPATQSEMARISDNTEASWVMPIDPSEYIQEYESVSTSLEVYMNLPEVEEETSQPDNNLGT